MKDINLLQKQIRSRVISRYMTIAGIPKAVCFTCGNAARFLEREGVDVLAIGEKEMLSPTEWWNREDIARHFPDYFDATSGNLPIFLMEIIGISLRHCLGDSWRGGRVKIGSGETLLCLLLAYPHLKNKIKPYRDGTPATAYSPLASLNRILELVLGVDISK